MKAIIFGSNGQDAHFLSILLKSKNIQVLPVSRSGNSIIGNVSDYSFVSSLIKNHKPNYIFHFAAISSTRHEYLFENYQAICQGTDYILESVRLYSPGTKVFLSGSALQFKNHSLPINENSEFEASSPYALSRIYSTYSARYYRDRFSLKVYVGYLFNHDSHIRSEAHINQKIVKAAQRISVGSNEILEIGDMNVKKEFNYAGDIVDAMWIFINQDSVFELVLGSGRIYSIRDWLKCCFDLVDKNWENHVSFKHDFISEYDILVSDPKLLFNLGWRPKVDLFGLAKIMMCN